MIKIYRDSAANAIFIEDANGVQFLNSLQTTVENGYCTITDLAKGIQIVSNIAYTDFVDLNGNTYGNTATEVCDALNAIFTISGTPSSELPQITSSTAISLVQGETLNYELTANYGVGYEWDLSNVPGVTTVEGNVRKIIGGSSLNTGTYSIPVKAINYNGEDSETITLTVSNPSFANTKSIQLGNQKYLDATPSFLQNTLGRSSNGSGSGDAWTIAFWFKPGTSNSNGQTVFYFGGDDPDNEGYLYVRYLGGGSNQRLRLQYGTNYNYLRFQSSALSMLYSNWYHVILTYDGGTTGVASDQASAYYSRFKMYIDGQLQSTSNSKSNHGYNGGITGENLRVGRFSSGNYVGNNAKIDELAVWDSDQNSNASDIYNNGTPHDLSNLATGPRHWWRMGDGDTYPYLDDNGSAANCQFQMMNMTSSDIVSDVPS